VSAASGEPVLLRGINWSGLEYNPAGPAIDELQETVRGWGANILRIPFNQKWALEEEDYRARLDWVATELAAVGAYTLLDLQWLDAETPRGTLADGSVNYVAALPDEGSERVWELLASRYREQPAVLFDLFNEPHDPLPDDVTESCRRVTARVWVERAEHLVRAVRRVYPESLLFVSGVNWGYDLRGVELRGVENVVYSTHVYPDKKPRWERAFGAASRSRAVFVAEWGFERETDSEWAEHLMAYLRERGIGWSAWSWRDRPYLRTADGRGITPFGELVQRELISGV
jgi:hypothetical protein